MYVYINVVCCLNFSVSEDNFIKTIPLFTRSYTQRFFVNNYHVAENAYQIFIWNRFIALDNW